MSERERYERYCEWCRKVVGCKPAKFEKWSKVVRKISEYPERSYAYSA